MKGVISRLDIETTAAHTTTVQCLTALSWKITKRSANSVAVNFTLVNFEKRALCGSQRGSSFFYNVSRRYIISRFLYLVNYCLVAPA